MSDPWDTPSTPAPRPSNRMQCDPKQPLPKLDPKEWAALGRDVAVAGRQMIDPLIDFGAAAAASERRRIEEGRRGLEEAVARSAREMEAKGLPQADMGVPKPIEDRFNARQNLELLKSQRYIAERAGDWARERKLAEQIAWLEYYLNTQSGGGQGASSGGGQSGQSGTGNVSTDGNDTPRSDGMQSETQGGAPLAPPPSHQAPAPTLGRGPIPQPDPPRRPPMTGGPYRTPGR